MEYELKFVGRRVGAIGIMQSFTLSVEAESSTQAVKKLYETHEHIGRLHINGVDCWPDGELKSCLRPKTS